MIAGLCECGCGQPAPLMKVNHQARGLVKGQPHRFIVGHNGRLRNPGYTVCEETGCWLWNGYVNPSSGYPGMVAIGGGRTKSAHVAFYEKVKGAVPEGLEIDHVCRVRRCVNPEHLQAVSRSVNHRRKPASHFSNERRAEVKRLCEEGLTHSEVARLVGLSRSMVSLVVAGKRWAEA